MGAKRAARDWYLSHKDLQREIVRHIVRASGSSARNTNPRIVRDSLLAACVEETNPVVFQTVGKVQSNGINC